MGSPLYEKRVVPRGDRAGQLRPDFPGQQLLANFLRRGTRKVLARPDKPAPHLLMLGQRLVGSSDYVISFHLIVAKNQYGQWFRPMSSLGSEDGARLYFRLTIQNEFNVFRV